MKIYVATRFEDYNEARAVMAVLRKHEHEITYDWTVEADAHPTGTQGSETERAVQAGLDLEGVRNADIILVLTHHSGGCGMWFEMGAGVALGKRVLVCGPGRDRTIFALLCERYEDVSQALAALCDIDGELQLQGWRCP